MECVNLAHQGHVLPRDRQCLVVGRRARECQDPAWPNDGQVVGSVDPRVALSHPALGERPFSTIILQRQLPDLRVEGLEIRRVRRGFVATKYVSGSCQQLLLPFRDLGGDAR